MKALVIVAGMLIGCNQFDKSDSELLAVTLHRSTQNLAFAYGCTLSGTYDFEGTPDHAELALDNCAYADWGGAEFSTQAPLVVTIDNAGVFHITGDVDYHLEGHSIGDDGSCDVSATIGRAPFGDGWLACGTACGDPLSFGCDSGQSCYDLGCSAVSR